MSVPLKTLIARLPASTRVLGNTDVEIAAVHEDSRRVTPGSLFVAVRGEHMDGHAFVDRAVASGAAAIVVDLSSTAAIPDSVVALYVPDTRRWLSALSSAFYHDPARSLQMIGVTGTNGKTTSTRMIAWVLNSARVRCGVIGTIGARFEEREWALANTTPLAPELHGLLAQMRDAGAQAVAMEVSSHALALDRVEDVHFKVAVLTNVTRDHLDFHGTMERYAAAKRRLFAHCDAAVINVDDESGARWAEELRARIPVITYSLDGNADIVATDLKTNVHAWSFVVDGREFILPMVGQFNVANALATIGVARALGIPDETTWNALYHLPQVDGRMEYVGDGVLAVFVDYAHTPDALENALKALRPNARDGLTVVFGCGGDRDRGKRAQMGAVAARRADRIVITNDNPRGEDPHAIIGDIERGMPDVEHEVEPDRRAAIIGAVESARSGEVILIAGKGHEKYQIVGDAKLPFDDVAIAREALRARRLRK